MHSEVTTVLINYLTTPHHTPHPHMYYRHGRILDGSEYSVAERVIGDHVRDKWGDVELPRSPSVPQQLFYLGGMECTCTHGKQNT